MVLAEKIPQRELRNPKKHVAYYNKNNPELFTEIIKNLQLKNKDKIKEIQQKKSKARDNPKILTEYSPLLHSLKTQHKELPNAIINEAKYDIIIEGKSYTFKNPETKFKINKNLSWNSKNVVYIIECSKCKETYIGSTQAIYTRTSLHRSNMKMEENGKLIVSKHLYQCSRGKFKIMPIRYQTDDYMLLQIKEKNFIDEFKPKLKKNMNRTHTHTHTQMEASIHIYIYIYTHKISRHTFTHTHRGKITISKIWNHSNTHIHMQRTKYQK